MQLLKGKVLEIPRELYEKILQRANPGERLGLEDLISIGKVRVIE